MSKSGRLCFGSLVAAGIVFVAFWRWDVGPPSEQITKGTVWTMMVGVAIGIYLAVQAVRTGQTANQKLLAVAFVGLQALALWLLFAIVTSGAPNLSGVGR